MEKSDGFQALCRSDVSMTFDPTLTEDPISIFLSVRRSGVDRGFSVSTFLTFQVGCSIVVGGCPRYCGVLGGITGLSRLDPHNIASPPT